MLGCRLLFKQAPVIDYDSILEELKKLYPAVVNVGNMLFTFPDLPLESSEQTIHVQCAVMPVTPIRQLPETVLQQNWHWPAAAQEAATCTHELLINDLMAARLSYKSRHKLFIDFLQAVVKVTQPDVVYSLPAEKLLSPTQITDQLDTLINVRLFNISDAASPEMFMDTIGMHTFGLPDCQVRFSNADPNAMATLLRNFAYYIFEKGDVIEDGNTIQGPTPGSTLVCQYAPSLVAPAREAISLT